MEEIWMTIDGLEEYYAFSNYGRIYNYKKKEYSVGNLNKKTGYYEKLLFKDGKYYKGGGIHKFIYEAFKGKIPKDMEINHIDFDKSNNAIWNLELVSHCKNMEHSGFNVLQYSIDGQFISEYSSYNEAERQTGVHHAHISSCCRGKRKTAGGFIWKNKEVA